MLLKTLFLLPLNYKWGQTELALLLYYFITFPILQ